MNLNPEELIEYYIWRASAAGIRSEPDTDLLAREAVRLLDSLITNLKEKE